MAPSTPEFMSQRPQLSRRGEKKKKKKKKPKAAGSDTPQEDGDDTLREDGVSPREDESLREELKDALERLALMKRTADLALQALDKQLNDGKWCVASPLCQHCWLLLLTAVHCRHECSSGRPSVYRRPATVLGRRFTGARPSRESTIWP